LPMVYANMSVTDSKRQPVLLVFAGPNGSGKTTVTRSLPTFGTYVNADDLKKEYDLTDLEAAQQADMLRSKLLDDGVDFSFETVMSTERNLLLMKRAKELGYVVQYIYVLTCDENINVARVKARYASGGHDVPEDKIRVRYHRALALLPKVIAVCDKILVYDNSVMPCLIFSKEDGQLKLYPNEYWPEAALQKIIG
jgi:predicted ABC-type ATPase